MGGFFGAIGNEYALEDVFYGTDYHSHLGTKSGGIAAYDQGIGLQRSIHHIGNSPFRTKFEHVFSEMKGTSAIGCINDSDPQPLLIRSKLGTYAICIVGIINNIDDIMDKYFSNTSGQFNAMTGGKINSTELIAALINQKSSFPEGIAFAQSEISGTASILILKDGGNIIAARDKYGRLPISIGQNPHGYCVSFEDFAYMKLGYTKLRELGPGEIVEITHSGVEVLKTLEMKKRICAFLWSYYGYPTSSYEGVNVEVMRYRNGEIMADNDRKSGKLPDIDYVGGVPDSGTPHAIGYARESGVPFARPFIKYTPTWPRSFMPSEQSERNTVAKMKQIPVHELIRGKDLLFVDDSIVRGTQLRETVEFLYANGAKSVHMRSACPPIMYGCKYLAFSRSTSDMELITRSTIMELEGEEGFNHLEEYSDPTTERGKSFRQAVCDKLHFSTLEFQTLDGLCEAIGIPRDEICTYCWDGKE
ncbi:MAG: amidophosphoribosyltransferase [Oscillospiraceae bacterium]|nr:amidophosphoribosyltransferase [Oscillospiraceae bacterium]